MAITSENTVLDRMLEPVTECFALDFARRIADLRADPELQARLDELASKSSEGSLSLDEQREYQEYVEAIDFVGLLQAKTRAILARFASP